MDVYVLSVERNFAISNENPAFDKFNDKKVDIIYLFNQG